MNKLKPHDKIRVFEGFAGYGGATYGLKRAAIDLMNLNNYRCIFHH